jgi:hypothetical protein
MPELGESHTEEIPDLLAQEPIPDVLDSPVGLINIAKGFETRLDDSLWGLGQEISGSVASHPSRNIHWLNTKHIVAKISVVLCLAN